jgi:hypothetical protein
MSVLLMWRRREEVEDLDVFFGMIHQFVRSNILRIEAPAAPAAPAPAKTMTMLLLLLLLLMMMMVVALLLQKII